MTAREIRERVKEIIAEVADLDPKEIGDDDRFVEDLDLDSLTLLELTVDVDYEFQLKVEEDRLKALTSIPETVALVEEILAERHAVAEVA